MLKRHIVLLSTIAALGVLDVPASASAVPAAPGWKVVGYAAARNMRPGKEGDIYLYVYNTGGAESTATTLSVTLPAGMKAVSGEVVIGAEAPICSGTQDLECEVPPVLPGKVVPVKIKVSVEAGAAGGPSSGARATIAAGGAPEAASTTIPVTYSAAPAEPGLALGAAWATNAAGEANTQAGSHPEELTVAFATDTEGEESGFSESVIGEIKNVAVNLPPGILGDPTAVPQCTQLQFDEGYQEGEDCPSASQVGFDTAAIAGGSSNFGFPVYNMVPPAGIAAQFEFALSGKAIYLDARVRSGGDYGITEQTDNIPQREITFNSTTIWGDPASDSHNHQRFGAGCPPDNVPEAEYECAPNIAPAAFLTAPTSCEAEQLFSVEVLGTWENESAYAVSSFPAEDAGGAASGIGGCENLAFAPSLSIAPETSEADTPTGLTADVKASESGLTSPEGLSSADIADTTVTLPEGVAINPGQAAGLVDCNSAEANVNSGEALGDEAPPTCPSASKVGTDSIDTPLLPSRLEGDVYVLESNPPDLKLLVAASGDGVNVKLVGEVQLNERTGQLTTSFANTPQLPFTNFELTFSGGTRAALVTPTRCGVYTSASAFTPWGSPFVSSVTGEDRFAIDSGSGGGACVSPLPFSPTLTAGSTTDQAGGYTGFSLLLTRPDGQQRIGGLQFKAPVGLLGMISKVTLCTNDQAETNSCPEGSEIGHTTVESGPGPYPLVVPEPGQPPAPIYLTEGYDGAPYGLSIVVPLHVGPFTLPTQRVRAKIEVNELTTALTVTTNPLPQVVAGVPTDLREVDAVIERPGFMFNPTNCEAQSFSGTAYGAAPPGSSEAAETAPISTRFQVGSCRSLEFKPDLTASASGRTSRRHGASLKVKIVYPTEKAGTNQATSQANIHYVKVELPKQLPSELKTLQQACLAKTFEEDPANCPEHSRVGSAIVHTPVLSDPLTGPAYFVSYGGAKFPELVLVLQGDGVTVQVHGETFISKKGVTSSTFGSVPDVPFSTFELNLPEGEYSALGANARLCESKLVMPTRFIGQNGAELTQQTKIAVTGCGKGIEIVSHGVSKRTLTLHVSVPSAGKLTLSGAGLKATSKKAAARETLTLKAKLPRRKGAARKLKLKLVFKPQAGGKSKRLSKTLSVGLPQ